MCRLPGELSSGMRTHPHSLTVAGAAQAWRCWRAPVSRLSAAVNLQRGTLHLVPPKYIGRDADYSAKRLHWFFGIPFEEHVALVRSTNYMQNGSLILDANWFLNL